MSTVITERRTYASDCMYKGVWDLSPRRVVQSMGTSLNYVERGQSLPGWKQRKAAGLGVTTNLNGVRTLLKKRVPINYIQQGLGYWQGASAILSGFQPLPLLPWEENVTSNWSTTAKARNDAAVEIHAQIARARSVFNMPTLLAEMAEIYSLFRKPAEAIFGHSVALAESVVKFKRSYYLNTGSGWTGEQVYNDYLTKLSSAYVAYQFAVKPLASDIADLAIGLDKLQNTLGNKVAIPLDARAEAFESVDEQVLGVQGATYATQRVFRTKKSEVRIHGKYRVLPNLSALSYFGFTAPDVVMTSWEALPWSFIIDYFYNVNSVLRAQVQCNADVAWLEEGTRQTFEIEGAPPRAYVPSPDSDSWTASCSGGQYLAQKIGVNRRPTAVPAVTLGFAAPPPPQKLLNVAALAELARAGRTPAFSVSG